MVLRRQRPLLASGYSSPSRRQWSKTKSWNQLVLVAEKRRAGHHETRNIGNIEVPVQFINAMLRNGLLTVSQAEDNSAIAAVLLSATEEKLYGRVKSCRPSALIRRSGDLSKVFVEKNTNNK